MTRLNCDGYIFFSSFHASKAGAASRVRCIGAEFGYLGWGVFFGWAGGRMGGRSTLHIFLATLWHSQRIPSHCEHARARRNSSEWRPCPEMLLHCATLCYIVTKP